MLPFFAVECEVSLYNASLAITYHSKQNYTIFHQSGMANPACVLSRDIQRINALY